MGELKFINLKECILGDNDKCAVEVRNLCKENNIFLWNVMSAPGAGKTTFLLSAIKMLKPFFKIAVIEGDIESTVDSEKMVELGIPTVQLRTGGDCHLDAPMIIEALKSLPVEELDIIIVENIGNLVCPAEFDLGSSLQSMILSVPEGDDKAIKYPLMFSICKLLIVSKVDTLPMFDFNFQALDVNAHKLNPDLKILSVSAKTGEGMDQVVEFIKKAVEDNKTEMYY